VFLLFSVVQKSSLHIPPINLLESKLRSVCRTRNIGTILAKEQFCMRKWCLLTALLWLLLTATIAALAQDNYESQVYDSELVPPGSTMVEIHSNFTVHGSKTVVDGVQPTNHAMHETLEITQGFNDWFETGLYVFSTIQPSGGWQWVGDHIRPRIGIPETWHWPVRPQPLAPMTSMPSASSSTSFSPPSTSTCRRNGSSISGSAGV
jgi:hypothetical protein